ncbi:hypothetical protein [Agromyces salentinus]|uniref:TadE family protein n=1 Tax=Agromyces salentinus TaxID=269421 RepID=A0ABN2MQ27_9MICO|nr:hypothetical protein [Agromyces salentinus]
MRRSKRWSERHPEGGANPLAEESGSASLEFLTVGLLLLVPIVYLVLSVAAIQAGAFAVEGAARHAARIVADGGGSGDDAAAVDRAVRMILDDYGVDDAAARVAILCETPACDRAGERVEVTVSARIPLPLVPDVFGSQPVASVPVDAMVTQTVSRFAGAR